MTETIPVSSSGHLMIFKKLLDVNVDFDTIAILTNFGSLIAGGRKYVYDISINEVETVIGYDNDGAKYFIIYPEASNDV